MVQTRAKKGIPNLQKGKSVSNVAKPVGRPAQRKQVTATDAATSSGANESVTLKSSASKPKKRVVAIATGKKATPSSAQPQTIACKTKKSKTERDAATATTTASATTLHGNKKSNVSKPPAAGKKTASTKSKKSSKESKDSTPTATTAQAKTSTQTKSKSSKPPPLIVRKKTSSTKSKKSSKKSTEETDASTASQAKTSTQTKSKSKTSKPPASKNKTKSTKSKKSNPSASDAQAAAKATTSTGKTKSTTTKTKKAKKFKKVDKLFKDAPTPQVILKSEKQASAVFAKEDAAGPARILSQNEILRLGLLYANEDISKSRAKRSKHVKSFKTLYGSDPSVIAKIWNELQTTAVKEAKIDGKTTCLKGFFMTMHFLRRYATETEQSIQFKSSENTVRKWRWFHIARLRALKKVKIVWPDEWVKGGNNRPIILLTVDGVHIRVQEPQHERYSKNPKFCSHKCHTSAVNYEVALDLAKSRIVHINGPFEASTHDITIFRQELLQKIPKGNFCIADRGYTGEPGKVMGPNSHDTEQVRKFKGRARSRHESVNKRFKNFKILDHTFIHDLQLHEWVFDAVAVIVQCQMDMGWELFDV